MELRDGYHGIPSGKLADVQVFLEMRERPPLRAAPEGSWSLERADRSDLARHRDLVHRVGDDYLWALRLMMSDSELEEFLGDPRVESYALTTVEGDGGILELDFRVAAQCELSLFGVAKPLIGTGVARWLINRGIDIAWSHPIERFWLHTCTLDHPNALAFYQRSGFLPFKRAVEIYDDPRVLGITPREAAPHVPIL
jgi:GNAT superfamily N-acetyltransferase